MKRFEFAVMLTLLLFLFSGCIGANDRIKQFENEKVSFNYALPVGWTDDETVKQELEELVEDTNFQISFAIANRPDSIFLMEIPSVEPYESPISEMTGNFVAVLLFDASEELETRDKKISKINENQWYEFYLDSPTDPTYVGKTSITVCSGQLMLLVYDAYNNLLSIRLFDQIQNSFRCKEAA